MPYKNNIQQKDYQREHYLDNKDEYYWKTKLNRALNPEKYKKIRKEYYEFNKEQEHKNKVKWRENNREKYIAGSKRSWDRRKEFENCVRRLKRKLEKYDKI